MISKNNLVKIAYKIIRVGYVRAVILIDIILVCIIILDSMKFIFKWGLDAFIYSIKITFIREIREWENGIFLLTSLILLLPVFLCIIRLFFNRKSKIHGNLAMEISRNGMIIHFIISIFVFSFSFILASLQLFSGLEKSGESWEISFRPYFGYIIKITDFLLHNLWIPLLAIIISNVWVFLLRKTEPSKYLKELLSRLTLLDLRGDLYPESYTPLRANFNAGAISPGIRAAIHQGLNYVKEYRRRSPGSAAATSFMYEIGDRCCYLTKELLFQTTPNRNINIAFTGSTSRALEICISNWTGSERIVMSPYEHPSEKATIAWLNHIGKISEEIISYPDEILLCDPNEKIDQVVDLMEEAIRKIMESQAKTIPILLISEVCWANGSIVPVDEIITKLKSKILKKIKIIVDGAHSVGNNRRIGNIENIDAYIFCGHKWLLSSEPIGVIITKEQWEQPYPIDLWIRNYQSKKIMASIATSGCYKLGHYLGALEMLKINGFDKLWERSWEFRNRLLSRIKEKYSPVASKIDSPIDRCTFILSLFPNQSFKWKSENVGQLSNIFESNKVSVYIMLDQYNKPKFLRTTLPYFLNLRDIDALVYCLDQAVQPI